MMVDRLVGDLSAMTAQTQPRRGRLSAHSVEPDLYASGAAVNLSDK